MSLFNITFLSIVNLISYVKFELEKEKAQWEATQ